MGKGEQGVLAQRAWDMQRGQRGHGAGLACHSPSATHLSCVPQGGVSQTKPHSNTQPRVPSMGPVCPLFDPPQSHSCVPPVSPGPTCVPGVFPPLVPPVCPAHVSHSCPICVPSMVPPGCPAHVSPSSLPRVPYSYVPPLCHPCVLFMIPCVPPVPPQSHPCVTPMCSPSASLGPTVCPHIPPMCPLCVSHLCFSFACPLQSLPVPSSCPRRVPPYVPRVSHPCVPLVSSF